MTKNLDIFYSYNKIKDRSRSAPLTIKLSHFFQSNPLSSLSLRGNEAISQTRSNRL
ncbi:hypothetical protein ACN4EE_21760 [Geminocystis sp. CENA526]|uniref:hypothetical protein n=1 Tax=Geminocystis sp. CENA526 TaxID=1355871 RepID=UPI003D6FF964